MSRSMQQTPDSTTVLVRTRADGRQWGTRPWRSSTSWPELPARPGGDNALHAPVRQALAALGLDAGRHGTPGWNPLGALVSPGGHVVLKPNMVRHAHSAGGPLEAVVTDPRVIRALLDYSVQAVAPGGQVTIADSPLQSCDLQHLSAALGLQEMISDAARDGVSIRVLDYRREAVVKGADGLVVRRTPLSGDPDGYVAVDLGEHSALRELDNAGRFRVTQYDPAIMARHHEDGSGRHEFLIPRSLLTADLVISIPKLKTHRKAGMTGALKNLVGINGAKSWLPHHRFGSQAEGGDEYLRPCWRKRILTRLWEKMDRTPSLPTRRLLDQVQRLVRSSSWLRAFPDPYFEGSWWGNRTIAAMVTDLNRIFMYADSDGRLADRPVRRFLVVADGILAGEGDGPLQPTPVPLGLLLAGFNPVAVDWVAATLMGFEPRSIPTLDRACRADARPLLATAPEMLQVLRVSDDAASDPRPCTLAELRAAVSRTFVPASGWEGRIEAAPGILEKAG